MMNEKKENLANSSIRSNLSEKSSSLFKDDLYMKIERKKSSNPISGSHSSKHKSKKKSIGFFGRLFGCCNESPEESKHYEPSRKKYSDSLLGSKHKAIFSHIDPNKFANFPTSESTAKTADEFVMGNKSFSKSLYSVENNSKEKGDFESGHPLSKKGKCRMKRNVSEEIASPLFLEKYKKNYLFFLPSESGKEFVLAKITEKKFLLNKSKAITSKSMMSEKPPTFESKSFFGNLKEKTCNQKFYDIGVNLFSLYDKNIKLDFESWCSVTPEKVAKDIAKRMKKFDVVVDAFCGAGGNLIQFAKECNLVIGVDNNETKIAFAKHNSQVYGVSNKIEFICTDFLSLSQRPFKADAIFLNPSWRKPEAGEKFSLFTHIFPDIRKSLSLALRISTNVCLLLPKYCDVSELATLFFEANYEQRRLSKFSIEIECIYINENFERIAVYFGDTHQGTKNDERDFLISYINHDNFKDIFYQETAPFLNYIIEKVGFHRLCEHIRDTEKEDLTNNGKTLFQKMIDRFQTKKLLSAEEVEKYMKPQKDLNGDVIGYFSNSMTDSMQETLIRNISLTSEFMSNYEKEMTSTEKKENSPKKSVKEKSEEVVDDLGSSKNQKEVRNKLYTYKDSEMDYTNSDEEIIYDDSFSPKNENSSEALSKYANSQQAFCLSKNVVESFPSNSNEHARKLKELSKELSIDEKKLKLSQNQIEDYGDLDKSL